MYIRILFSRNNQRFTIRRSNVCFSRCFSEQYLSMYTYTNAVFLLLLVYIFIWHPSKFPSHRTYAFHFTKIDRNFFHKTSGDVRAYLSFEAQKKQQEQQNSSITFDHRIDLYSLYLPLPLAISRSSISALLVCARL